MDKAYLRTAVAIAAAEHFSPTVRASIIGDADFRRQLGIAVDATVAVGGVRFQRSLLFDAIRGAFNSSDERSLVSDEAGDEWTIELLHNHEPLTVALRRPDRQFLMSALALLAPDKNERLSVFAHRAR